MNPIAFIFVAIAHLFWPQPGTIDYDDLPPQIQRALKKECNNYGQVNGVVFERHAEHAFRRALKKYIDSGRDFNQATGYSNEYAATRESDAWGISTRKTVSTDPPYLWTIHGLDRVNPSIYSGPGHHQFTHCGAKIRQALGGGEALVTFENGKPIFHLFGVPDYLVDGSEITEPGYLIRQEQTYDYTAAFGAPHSVISFEYIPESEIRVEPQQLIDAIVAGEVSAYRFAFKRTRPTSQQRDQGIEDVYEWRRIEVLPTILKRIRRDAETQQNQPTP